MLKNISYMKEFAIILKKNGWMFVGQIFGNICLNSCCHSVPYILDIYTKKYKVLRNINDINYIGIPFIALSQKSLDCAHGIHRKAELKKKRRTWKDTENVRCLILWDSLWIYIRSKIPMSRSCSQGFFFCWVMIYDRRSPEK